MRYLICRFKEPSSYAGFGLILNSIALIMNSDLSLANILHAIGSAMFGFTAFAVPAHFHTETKFAGSEGVAGIVLR